MSPLLVAERFWSRVEKTPTCWLWRGPTYPNGYARFTFGRSFETMAYRFSYELAYGSIPLGLFVCHHCDNPKCVRPDHLFIGTARDNLLDAIRKGRHAPPEPRRGDEHHFRLHPELRPFGARNGSRTHPESVRRGQQHPAAKLTAERVATIRSTYRRGSRWQPQPGRTLRDLGAKYGVSSVMIGKIVRGENWKGVPA